MVRTGLNSYPGAVQGLFWVTPPLAGGLQIVRFWERGHDGFCGFAVCLFAIVGRSNGGVRLSLKFLQAAEPLEEIV